MKFKQFIKKIKNGINKVDDYIYGDEYALSIGDITQKEYDDRKKKKKKKK